jgi:hypothetical protein
VLDLLDQGITAVDWSTANINEIDLTSTDLSERIMLELFAQINRLTYLAVAFCDGFTDQVLNVLFERGVLNHCRTLDLSNTVNLSTDCVHRVLTSSNGFAHCLEALSYTGLETITEHFWIDVIRYLKCIK